MIHLKRCPITYHMKYKNNRKLPWRISGTLGLNKAKTQNKSRQLQPTPMPAKVAWWGWVDIGWSWLDLDGLMKWIHDGRRLICPTIVMIFSWLEWWVEIRAQVFTDGVEIEALGWPWLVWWLYWWSELGL